MATFIKAGFWEKLCKPCKGYKGWLNLDEFVKENSSLPYKVYTALLTQEGTNPPTAQVLQNTLGIDITYEYSDLGTYIIRLSDFVDVTKLYINVQGTANNSDSTLIFNASTSGMIDTIFLTSILLQNSFPYADSIVSNAPLEIRVYP
jgi:hypothetical protein